MRRFSFDYLSVLFVLLATISFRSICFGVLPLYTELLDSDGDRCMAMAHRGDWRNHPENSLSGVQSCIDNGIDIVEFDVRKTTDGVLVLMHDSTVNRTTNGSGYVSSLTLAQIKELRLIGPNGLTDEKVPTLEEAMLLIKGKAIAYLDKIYPSIVGDCYNLLNSLDMLDHAIFRATGSAQAVMDTYTAAGVDPNDVAIAFKITCSGTTSPTMEEIWSELNIVKPEVLQVNYNNAIHPIFDLANISAIRQSGSRIYVNTLIGRVHEDPEPNQEPTDWDWVVNRNINLLQTDRALWIVPYLNGYAYHETPVDGTTAGTNTSLSWMRARNVDHHDLYLGTSHAAVSGATTASPEYKGPLSTTSYSPIGLTVGMTYYWRVDEVLSDGTSKPGEVWSFTTETSTSNSALYLHLKAGDLALANGAAVTSWTDSVSGNVLEGTAEYVADWNGTGHAAVYFNGISDVLTDKTLAGYDGAGGTPNTSSATLFVVGQLAAVDSTIDYMVSCQDVETDVSGNNRLRLATGGSDWRHRVGAGANQDGGTNDTETHIFTVVSGQGASNATEMFVDGNLIKTGTHGIAESCLDLSRINLCAYYSGETGSHYKKDFANCYIAEVLVYDGAMTDFEITNVNASLKAEYNFTPTWGVDPMGAADALEGYDYNASIAGSATAFGGVAVLYSKVSVEPTWLMIAQNGNLSGVPAHSDVGLNTCIVRATDIHGISSDATLNIMVLNTFTGELGLPDFAALASRWLDGSCSDVPPCGGADLTGEGMIDIDDLQRFFELWLI